MLCWDTMQRSPWVSRLAATYAMTQDEFFQYALDTEPLADHRLDRQPPRHLVDDLSGRTGVPPARIWAMTLVGYVPWLIDTLDTTDAACLHTYATQYQTLLRCHTPWMSKDSTIVKLASTASPGWGNPIRAITPCVWPVSAPIGSRICASFGSCV